MIVETEHPVKEHLHVTLDVRSVQENRFVANDFFHIGWTELHYQVQISIADEDVIQLYSINDDNVSHVFSKHGERGPDDTHLDNID